MFFNSWLVTFYQKVGTMMSEVTNVVDFKKYMEMNVYFNYLKEYYNSLDMASVYGVEKMEIKHSNVLKWLLEPGKNAGNKAISYFPIRKLLKLIQDKKFGDEYFEKLNIDEMIFSDVKVMRERNNIDLLITLKLNEEKYVVVIENKLEYLIHDNQLQKYKDNISKKYESYQKLFVFLYPGYKLILEQQKEVDQAGYITITYQDIYDYILKDTLKLSNDLEMNLILSYYIHTLSCYSSDTLTGLITTDEEKDSLSSLFEDEKFLEMIDSLYRDEMNEYSKFYRDNKVLFIQIFKKYLFISEQSELTEKVKSILKNKSYILNGEPYNGIGTLLQKLFEILLENYSVEDLYDLIHLYPESVPLLIKTKEIGALPVHKNWYLNNPKYVEDRDGKKYYVLSSWNTQEYEELKNKVNELNGMNQEIYGDVSME